jgi:hypothetical protein
MHLERLGRGWKGSRCLYACAAQPQLFTFCLESQVMPGLFRQFVQFAREEKKWIILPLIVLLVLLAAIVFLVSGGGGISWALYPTR